MTIAIGLSGGVDSSATAHLLKEEGHTVFGATMRLLPGPQGDNEDAARVARELDIPHIVIDLTDAYKEIILKYIQQDYANGRTPNPCVYCNKFVKFGEFLDRLYKVRPFDKFATGHYARIIKDADTGRFGLQKGTFSPKDQAYFLSLLNQEQLSRILFPLGEMKKDQVREIAEKAGLFTSQKKESQDLCIGGYRDYLDSTSGPGDFISTEGKILGTHKGIENYTIGQRKGLGIGATQPLYVVKLDKENNRVILGDNDQLFQTKMVIRDLNWGFIPPEKPPFSGQMKIRYADDGCQATISRDLGDGRFLVEFAEPRRAITPGQLAVMYRDQTVALGAVIEGPFTEDL